jgi:hypothetical protein
MTSGFRKGIESNIVGVSYKASLPRRRLSGADGIGWLRAPGTPWRDTPQLAPERMARAPGRRPERYSRNLQAIRQC